MHTSTVLDLHDMDAISGTDVIRPPQHSRHWFRFSTLGLGAAFLAAAAYFFTAQVFTVTSLEGTVTSPLITVRSSTHGIVTAHAAGPGAHVDQQHPLFSIQSSLLDTRLRGELEAQLAGYEQQNRVIARKIAELTMLRTQLHAHRTGHRVATLARLAHAIDETTAQLHSAQAVSTQRQTELARVTSLAADGYVAPARLDEAVLVSQQARFDVERLTASLQRLTGERSAAQQGILVGEGYSDAPYSQQRMDEIAVRLIELHAERESVQHARQEIVRRLAEEQQPIDQGRTHAVYSPIHGVVWNLHVASGAVVTPNTPLADVVDCQNGFVEARIPARRYDAMQMGERVHVKLLGNSRTIAGTIHAVHGQSAVVNRNSFAASLTPHRTTEALTISVALDPEALHQVSPDVCQIGRSATVYFAAPGDDSVIRQSLTSLTGVVSSAFAALRPSAL